MIFWRGRAARPMSTRILLIAGDVARHAGPVQIERAMSAPAD